MSESSGHHERRTPRPMWMVSVTAATVVAAVGCLAAAVQTPHMFWSTYLVAAVFWMGVSLGCLGIGLMHRLTGGRWGWAVSRELHAGMGALPVAALGLTPLIAGAPYVYPWAAGESVRATLGAHQQSYLAPAAVLLRTLVEVLIWCGMTVWMVRGYVRSTRGGQWHRAPQLSALGLIAVWLTITFASIDGLMSLNPGWSSSMFGALRAMGCALTGLSFAVIARSMSIDKRSLPPDETDVTQDLGSLLLAFNLLWAYLAFSEYLIVWSGDLPFEVRWFIDRQRGWRLAAAAALIVLHFAVPFLLLLSRNVKRNPRALAGVAGLLLAMELCHVAWTVLPAAGPAGPLTALLLIASVTAVGGPWLLVFVRNWRRLPPIGRTVVSPLDAVNAESRLEGAT